MFFQKFCILKHRVLLFFLKHGVTINSTLEKEAIKQRGNIVYTVFIKKNPKGGQTLKCKVVQLLLEQCLVALA